MTDTIAEVTPETIAYLESLFEENHPCSFRKDGLGLGSPEGDRLCDLPATWVWTFELTCKCPVPPEYYLCGTHHTICERLNRNGNPWPCTHCLAGATVKEIRRIK